jgi:hypothetical protein
VADPLGNVILVSRSVFLRGTDISVSSSHTKALGELEGLAHLASAGIDVVDLVTIGLERLSVMRRSWTNQRTYRNSEVGAVVGLDVECRVPVSTLVLDDRAAVGTSDTRAA